MPSPRQLPTRQVRGFKSIKLFDPREFLANAASAGRYVTASRIRSSSRKERPPTQCFYVQEGWLRLSVLSKQGKEATIGLLGPEDFLGEGCIASDQPIRMATATATTACSVLEIRKREMIHTLHEEHRFSDLFVACLVQRHNHTQTDSSPERIAHSRTPLSTHRFQRRTYCPMRCRVSACGASGFSQARRKLV